MSLGPLVTLAHVDDGRVGLRKELAPARDVDLVDLALDLLQELAIRGHFALGSIATSGRFETRTLGRVSPHTRVRLLVGAAALAAAAVAVAGGLLLDGTQAEEELGEPPALELGVLPGEDAQTRALLAAERT